MLCVRLCLFLDTLIFKLTAHNDSLLRCEVNVTPVPGFVLSIHLDGRRLPTVDSALGDYNTSLLYIILSETVSMRNEGTYECQLHLNEDLISKSIFHYHQPGNNPLLTDFISMHAHHTLVVNPYTAIR